MKRGRLIAAGVVGIITSLLMLLASASAIIMMVAPTSLSVFWGIGFTNMFTWGFLGQYLLELSQIVYYVCYGLLTLIFVLLLILSIKMFVMAAKWTPEKAFKKRKKLVFPAVVLGFVLLFMLGSFAFTMFSGASAIFAYLFKSVYGILSFLDMLFVLVYFIMMIIASAGLRHTKPEPEQAPVTQTVVKPDLYNSMYANGTVVQVVQAEPNGEKHFCKYCGKEIENNSEFCKFCGKSQK